MPTKCQVGKTIRLVVFLNLVHRAKTPVTELRSSLTFPNCNAEFLFVLSQPLRITLSILSCLVFVLIVLRKEFFVPSSFSKVLKTALCCL